MHEAEPHHATEKREPLRLGKEIVALIGPEGSGKTSIGKRLADESRKPFVTVGGILRDMAASDYTEYGNACRAIFAEHGYLDSQMLLEILVRRFRQNDLAEGFIIDGGLRQVEEIVGFQSVLERADRAMPVSVVHLRIPGWMSLQRLVAGENARKRNDDTVEGVLSRLSRYYNQLGQKATLIQQQENWRLLHVNATGTKNEVLRNACSILQSNSR